MLELTLERIEAAQEVVNLSDVPGEYLFLSRDEIEAILLAAFPELDPSGKMPDKDKIPS